MALEAPDRAKILVEDLCFFYGKKQTLHNNHLPIAEHRVTAIVGPSGCGKSTHLRTYNRMFDLYPGQIATGRVLLDGVNILDRRVMDGLELRSRVGMVLQYPTPFPMSIWDNVAFGPKLAGLDQTEVERRVIHGLQQARLWDDVRHRLRQDASVLSVVQQQTMCVARALAMDPEVLLLDEPCEFLDPSAGDGIEQLVRSMSGVMTVVLATRNAHLAARISDYTAVMFDGEVAEHASTDVLFTRPALRRTEDFISGHFG